MLDMPILKFEKSTKYLQNQLGVQKNNKQLVLDIITNIGLILNDDSITDKTKYESVLESANLFLQTITSNITTIEQLSIEIKNITSDLSDLLAENGKPTKTKEFYIAAFTNIKQTIVVYSKKMRQLEDRLTIDNNNFNDFITENNIKYNYETTHSEGNSDTYKFTGFSLNEENTETHSEESNYDDTILEESTVSATENSSSNEIDIDVDNLSNDILSQTNVENIVNDYEISERNEKIDKLTNEFRNLLLDTSNSDEETAKSVLSLFKEVLPNHNSDIDFIENLPNDTTNESDDIGDLISDVIKESSVIKPEMKFDKCNGLNMNSIISEFTIASTEGKNHEELINNIIKEPENEIIELPPVPDLEQQISENSESTNEVTFAENDDHTNTIELEDIDDLDSLLSLITEEDLNELENNSITSTTEEKNIEENLEETPVESDENIVSQETSQIENTAFQDIDKTEMTEETSSKLSYSEMYNSFYPNSQKEDKSLTVDFTSLENSFKEFDKLLNEPIKKEISYPTFEETLYTPNTTPSADNEIFDLFTPEDIEENLLEEISQTPSVSSSVSTKAIENSDIKDEIVVNEKINKDMTSLFDKKIAKIEEGKFDNETLLISERTEKIYLPYKTTELLNYIHSYPNLYKSLSDVVKQEFVLPYTYFTEHPTKSRYAEAYNLIRNREGKNIFTATAFAIKMARNRSLNPAIIASCKSKRELDSYLDCLNNNKLDSFKEFRIAYEVNPI